MKFELLLLATACLLSMLVLSRRRAAPMRQATTTTTTTTTATTLQATASCELGFERSMSRAWTANAFDEQRFLFHQWRAAVRLGQRRRRRPMAYALLLDGDDAARHYTDAAVAHARLLRASDASVDIVLLLNRRGENLAGAEARLRPLVSELVGLDGELAYDRRHVELVKHVNKLELWRLDRYGKLVFIDLDVVLRGSQARLFAWPGEPASFLANPENPFHFNSGIAVIEPDNFTYARLVDTLRSGRYRGGWDYTDQALVDAALRSVFGQLPLATCPKKRMLYTHAALWHRSGAACVHWTGEKPWAFQKRADLAALVPDWYDYMRQWVPNYTIPQTDWSELAKKKKSKN